MDKKITLGELRVGNWFENYQSQYFQWDFECFEMIGISINGADIDEIIKAPIPITEMILQKSGFEYHPFLKNYYIDKESFFVSVKKETTWTLFYQGENIKVRIVCKYLHELQNTHFAVTGEELEVKL